MTTPQRTLSVSQLVAGSAPGIFTVDASGQGQAAILHEDSSLNGVGNPAKRGSTVSLYATGEGQTTPPGENGLINAGAAPKPNLSVYVRIGMLDAKITYAGAAPFLVSGLLQVNVTIPDQASIGDSVPISLQVGSRSSQPGPTLTIR